MITRDEAKALLNSEELKQKQIKENLYHIDKEIRRLISLGFTGMTVMFSTLPNLRLDMRHDVIYALRECGYVGEYKDGEMEISWE